MSFIPVKMVDFAFLTIFWWPTSLCGYRSPTCRVSTLKIFLLLDAQRKVAWLFRTPAMYAERLPKFPPSNLPGPFLTPPPEWGLNWWYRDDTWKYWALENWAVGTHPTRCCFILLNKHTLIVIVHQFIAQPVWASCLLHTNTSDFRQVFWFSTAL